MNLRVVGALAVALFATAALPACGKKVPEDVKPTLDAVRADARKVAGDAAKLCAAQLASGRFTVTAKGCATNKLPGEDIVPPEPCPAKGTSLEANPNVVDVQFMCMVPVPGRPSESCGTSLGALHTPILMPIGHARMTSESTCAKSPRDCEEVVVPSQYVQATNTADLRIVKPVAGAPGATVEVSITLAKK